MTDERLKTFLTVARCGSLTRAARELYISQPAVTLQIHKLESRYNTALFYRKDRGVELTPAGKLLFEFAQRIGQLYDEASEELGALNGEMRGKLRLGATLTIGEYVLPSVIGQFKSVHPNVDVLLEVGNTRRIVEQVAAGMLDCGLVEGPFGNGLIRAEKLGDDELAVICSPRQRLAGAGSVSLDDLLNEQFILREHGSGTRQVFEDALQQAGVDLQRLQVLMQLGSTQAIKALVSENIGLSVLSRWTVVEDIRQGTLCTVSVQGIDLRRAFNFIYQKDARLSLITQRFINLCHDCYHRL